MSKIYVRQVATPGEVLRREMRARGVTNADLARQLGITERRVQAYIWNEQPFSPQLAKKCARLFRTSLELWLSLCPEY